MATTSLGRLTLDLAVKLSEFTDGMSKAERETKQRTDNMRRSVRTFKEQVMELGGSEVGGAIGNMSNKLGLLRSGGMVAGAALGGALVGGALLAAGSLTRLALNTSQADVQLAILANRANTSLYNFQVLGSAAQQLGVSQEQLGSILADVQEKLGEFSATEGGGAADFFEALQNNTSLTTEEIRELGRTVQGKDGVEAIQLMKDKMDELGATQQEQRFVFESLASDLGNLMPLFEDGGELLAKYGEELEAAGVIKTEAAIEQSQILAAQTQALHLRYDGLKQQLSTQMMPVLNNLLEYFVGGSQKGNQFGGVIKGVGYAAKATGTIIVGLAAGVSALVKAFTAVYDQFYNLGQTGRAFWEADGILAKIDALNAGMSRAQSLARTSVTDILGTFSSAVNSVQGMWSDSLVETDGLSAALFDLNKASMHAGSGLNYSTKQANEQAKAAEKSAKATKKQAEAQARLVGISGNTGIGTGAHLDIRYARGDARFNTAPSAAHLARFQANGKALTDYRKTSGFGHRKSPTKGASSWHRGIDFAMPVGTKITTTVGVKDVKTFYDKKGGGWVSNVEFEDGVKMSLLHQSPAVKGVKGGPSGGTYKGAFNEANSLLDKHALEVERQQKELLRKQQSITIKYASEREKLVIEHEQRVAEIKEAYAEGSAERAKYLAEEEERFTNIKAARIQSIADKYLNEEKLKEEQEVRRHQKAIEQIKLEFVEDDPSRQLYLDLEDKKHQEELKKIKWANQAKLREQQKYIESLRDSMQSSMDTSLQSSIDRTMQSTLRPEEYEQWRLGEDEAQAYNSASSQYQGRISEINKTGELGEYVLPEEERFKLLEEAKLEHEQKLYSIESEYSAKRLELDKQQAAMRSQIQASAFSDMTSAASMFFGENSKLHRAAFALERAYAVHKAVMNIEETYSNTFNAVSAIPIIGPYIAGPMAAVASAMQVARAAKLKGMSPPGVSGIAHGGLDYVPETATYLLKEGEGVIQPKQNKALTNFLSKQDKNSGSNITIIESPQTYAKVSQDNGQVTVQMVDKMIKNSFKKMSNPNSFESKQIQRHTTARPRR